MTIMTIWKFPLLVKAEQELSLPRGAQFLCCRLQDATPTIWVLVDDTPGVTKETRLIHMHGTGHNVLSDSCYIGTVQLNGVVRHYFEARCRI